MSTKAVFTALLLLFLTLTSMQFVKSARTSRIWTVDKNGPADFHSIQEAVDAAGTGDTVLVYSGTYLEHVFVNKTISLIGQNPFDTIIDGQGKYLPAILLEANDVVVSNFTLRDTLAHWYLADSGGVYLYSCNGCSIEDCILSSNSNGINLRQSAHNDISNNLLTGNGLGIWVWDSSNNNLIGDNWIINNSLNEVSYGEGIALAPSSRDTTILGNYFCNNSLFINSGDQGSIWGSSATGIVTYNNFMQNVDIKIDYYSGMEEPQPNIAWSKDGEGNFWTNYTGVDANGDGLGDAPYIVPYIYEVPYTYPDNASRNDNFPLMRPHNWPEGDVNYDMVINILDISMIARAFDSRLGDLRWNPNCDLNNDKTINILDISLAASNFEKRMTWLP